MDDLHPAARATGETNARAKSAIRNGLMPGADHMS
jgi:hypothetical protein